jgi:hypothetical protein
VAALGAAAVLLADVTPARAQDTNGNGRTGEVWRLQELQNAFCVRFLVDPAEVSRKLPRGTRPLPASQIRELHPAVRGVIEDQPEFAAWAPSNLCFFYFGLVEVDGDRVSDRNPSKAPMLGFWTVATADSLSGTPQDFALEVITNSGRLESSAGNAGLNVRLVRSSVGEVPPGEEGVPTGIDRYQVRVRKTQIIWDGRAASDSAPPQSPVEHQWKAQGRRGRWVNGEFAITADWTRAMIGSLKVQGKDDLARSLKASPIRFVGPAYHGGAGSLQFGR